METLSEEELLEKRIKDLDIAISQSEIEGYVHELYSELSLKNLLFKPECYLADEWLCPDQEPVIGIPFYLADPHLKKLEMKMMLEVEGGSKHEFMKLLRHECGHAINYAFALYRKRAWKETFGSFYQEYTETYRARPYSKKFVRHLDNGYAQYHPDEDFAETFAVWLTPNSNWQEEYIGWPALKKLKKVDEWMKALSDKQPPNPKGKKYWEASKMKSKLTTFYKKKRTQYAEDLPGFYNPTLQRIFSNEEADKKNERAARFLWRHRKEIINTVAKWTGRNKFSINKLLRQLIQACKDLSLHVGKSETETLMDITSFITTRIVNYLFTGSFKVERDKHRL